MNFSFQNRDEFIIFHYTPFTASSNIFHKILLFIASLIGLLFSLCIVAIYFPIPYITDVINNLRKLSPWIDFSIAIFAVIIGICFIVLLFVSLFIRVKSSVVITGKDRGTLRLSKRTIESTVRYSFADVYDIGYYKVKVNLNKNPGKIRINVKLSFTNPEKIAELTDTIQSKIDNALKLSLGLEVENINIDVLGVRERSGPPPDMYDY